MRGVWNGNFDEIKVKAALGDALRSKETSKTQVSDDGITGHIRMSLREQLSCKNHKRITKCTRSTSREVPWPDTSGFRAGHPEVFRNKMHRTIIYACSMFCFFLSHQFCTPA